MTRRADIRVILLSSSNKYELNWKIWLIWWKSPNWNRRNIKSALVLLHVWIENIKLQQSFKRKMQIYVKNFHVWISVLVLSLPNAILVCLQPPTWFIWVCQCATILKLVSLQNIEMQATRSPIKTKTRKNNNCNGV